MKTKKSLTNSGKKDGVAILRIFMPMELHRAFKVRAAETCQTMNSIGIRMIEEFIAGKR